MFPKCKANEQRRKKACLRLKHHSPRSIVLLHVQVLAAISAFITLNGPCAGDINKSGFSTRKAKLHDDHFSTNTNYIAKFAVLLASTFSCTDKWCPLWISSNKSVTTSFFFTPFNEYLTVAVCTVKNLQQIPLTDQGSLRRISAL